MYNLRPYIKFKNKDIYRKDYDTHSTESVQRILLWLTIFIPVIKISVKKLKQENKELYIRKYYTWKRN